MTSKFLKAVSVTENDRAFAEGQRKRIHEALKFPPEVNQVQQIPLDEIDSFPNHPFKVRDDEDMEQLVESIREKGVLTPATVRQKPDGRYELISGHRRKHACERAGLKELPALIVKMDDDEAVIRMVDANLQREHILPSEKAFAYKAKLDAMKRQGKRTDLTSVQVAPKLAAEQIAETDGTSKDTVKRYIRLTYLIPELLQKVDEEKLPFMTGVTLSYLRTAEQEALLKIMDGNGRGSYIPSLQGAESLKRRSGELQKTGNAELSEDEIYGILIERKLERVEQPPVATEANEDSAEEERVEKLENDLVQMIHSLAKPSTPEEPRMKIVQGGDAAADDDLHVSFERMNESLAELDEREKAARTAKVVLKKLTELYVWFETNTSPEAKESLAAATKALRETFSAQGLDM